MPPTPKIPDDELRELWEAGLSDDAIGEQYGLSAKGVQYRRLRLGLRKRRHAGHGDVIPWTGKLKAPHVGAKTAQYVRTLDSAGKGVKVPKDNLNTALNWAADIVAADRDVEYDPDIPPNSFERTGGFRLVPADDSSLIKYLYDRANSYDNK